MNKYKNFLQYFCDFETLTKDSVDFKKLGHTDVYLIYLLGKDTDKFFYNMDTFIDYLFTKRSSIVYFHNLSFDGDFIIKYLIRRWPQWFISELTEDTKKKENYYCIFNNGNKYYSIKIKRTIYKPNGKKRKIYIVFKCTYNLLNTSIKSLGASLGFDKDAEYKELKKNKICNSLKEFYDLGGFNMSPEVEYYFKKYIKKDVEIAKLSYENFKNEIQGNKKLVWSKRFNKDCFINIDNELTIARVIYKISINTIYNNFNKMMVKKYRITGPDYDLMQNWYYGGAVQFNEAYYNKWLEDINLVSYDINSSYPFQSTKLLPVGKFYKKIKSIWKHHLTYYEIEVESAIIKSKYYNFVILKNWNKKESIDRYVRVLGNFKCYYLKEEWDFLKKIYDFKVKKINVYYCEAQYILKPLIDTLYKYKQKASEEKDEAKKLTYKIAANSLYGSQCMRKQYENLLYVDKKTYDDMKKQYRENGDLKFTITKKKKTKAYKVVGFKNDKIFNSDYWGVYVLCLEEKRAYSHILIGATITAYGRLQLWEAIYNVGVDNWFYNDTDSIFIKKVKNIEQLINIHNNNLGAWKQECEIDKGKILGAKRYYFVNTRSNKTKFAMSGLEIKEEDFDWYRLFNDQETIVGGQHLIKRDDYGIYFDYRDYKIKKGGL